MKTQQTFTFSALAVAMTLAGTAHAQEAINTNAALQPPPGVLIYRQQFRYTSLEADNGPAEADLYRSISTFIYGMTPKLTLIGTVPIVYRDMDMGAGVGAGMGGDEDFGIADITALAKYQFYSNNFGVGSTFKAGVLGGAQLPSFDDTFSSDSVDPIGGGVVTYAQDRHGLNADLTYQLNTGGDDDEVKYNLGYTFRVQPASFAEDDSTALFAVLEINGLYETNGDNETLLSPGVQYVTNDWTIEATFQFPILQDVNNRMQTEYATGLIFRLRF